MHSELVEKAKTLATRAHAGQKRKSGEDFITHPEAVYNDLLKINPNFPDYVLAAAWLHDVLENCEQISESAILLECGIDVFNIVKTLTRKKDQDYFSYIINVRNNINAKHIKIADLCHNIVSWKEPGSLKDKWKLAVFILTSDVVSDILAAEIASK